MFPCLAHSLWGLQPWHAHTSCKGNAHFQNLHISASESPSAYSLPPGSPVQPTERPRVPSWRPQRTQASKPLSFWAACFLTLLITKKCLLSFQSALACGSLGERKLRACSPQGPNDNESQVVSRLLRSPFLYCCPSPCLVLSAVPPGLVHTPKSQEDLAGAKLSGKEAPWFLLQVGSFDSEALQMSHVPLS